MTTESDLEQQVRTLERRLKYLEDTQPLDPLHGLAGVAEVGDEHGNELHSPDFQTPAAHLAIGNSSPHHAAAHTPESHTGTDITATELETLSDGSDADALHGHPSDLTPAEHTAIGDAAPHHAKYTDAEAVAAAKTVKLDDFTTPDDNADLDASITKHGLLKKLNNVASNFFNGQGAWLQVAFSVVSGTISDAQHGVRSLANAHAHANLSGVTSDQHHSKKFTKVLPLEAPSNSEDIVFLGFLDRATTITQVNDVVAGTTPSITWNIHYAAARNDGAPTKLWTADRTTTSESGAETTTFNNAAIPAGRWVWLVTTAKSGTVTKLEVTVEAQDT